MGTRPEVRAGLGMPMTDFEAAVAHWVRDEVLPAAMNEGWSQADIDYFDLQLPRDRHLEDAVTAFDTMRTIIRQECPRPLCCGLVLELPLSNELVTRPLGLDDWAASDWTTPPGLYLFDSWLALMGWNSAEEYRVPIAAPPRLSGVSSFYCVSRWNVQGRGPEYNRRLWILDYATTPI